MKPHKFLVVLADGEHARFVRPNENNVLKTVACFDSISAHKRSSDLGSDRPGAAFHSGASAHHALVPRHDRQRREKQLFCRLVAQQVNDLRDRDMFDRLVVVAPAHSLAVICDEIEAIASIKIVGMLNKDLVKVPDDALWPHLREWVPQARPPRTLLPHSNP